MTARAAALPLLLAAAGCTPQFDDQGSLVTAPLVVAIQAEPPEAKPGEAIAYTALLVAPPGAAAPALRWSYCTAPKPLTEIGPVDPRCLDPSGATSIPLGTGLAASGALPADGCQVFGPDQPVAVAGQPAGRPPDPDGTGGYYQPVTLLGGDGEQLIGSTRLVCGLAGASQSLVVPFSQNYRLNRNPEIARLIAHRASGDVDASAGEVPLAPGENVTWEVAWAPCPSSPACGDGVCSPGESAASCPADCTTPQGCSGQEAYLSFDPVNARIALRREAMQVAWFATAGAFSVDTTGSGEFDPPTNKSQNSWTAPATSGAVSLWFVLRDARGGTGWASATARVP